MKKIVSLIFLVVFVVSCSNDDSEEFLYNETQKVEKKFDSSLFARDGSVSGALGDSTVVDSIPPPPPINPGSPNETCETCPYDPPIKGGKP